MEFNYYYDFEDCFQLDLSGNPITYVVGSDDVLSSGAPYIINPIEEPSQRVCAIYTNSSVSTASTHYTDISLKYDDCPLCLEANNQVVTVSGITKPNLSSLNLIADSRFKKGEITTVDIVYDDNGITKFLHSPVYILDVSPYTNTGSTIPATVPYVTYDSFQQIIESKGLYYSVEDCSDGTISTILSHQYFEKYGQIIIVPYGNSQCKKILNILSSGDYSEISGDVIEIYSTKVFDNCYDCANLIGNSQIDETFNQNEFTTNEIKTINQLSDGSILVGGSGLTHVSGGSLYNIGNLLKMSSEGELILNFNSDTGGSLSLYNKNYIFTEFNNNFGFEGDFTVEFWINYSTTNMSDPTIVSFYNNDENEGWEIGFSGLNKIIFTYNGNQILFDTPVAIFNWVHIALVRESDNLNLFVNGQIDSNSQTGISETITATTGTSFYIGTNYDGTSSLDAYISNLRICQLAVYNGNFIPQTTKLTTSQPSFGNISSVVTSATTLLMNFETLSTLLTDYSMYKNNFNSYKPSVTFIPYKPSSFINFDNVFDDIMIDDFYELEFPEGYELNTFGVKISKVYIGSNSYLTFEQGSSAGGLILPDEIPSEINSSGLFISTLGELNVNDNSTYIRKISTGFTSGDNILTIKVEGGYKNYRGGGGFAECKCFRVRNNTTDTISITIKPCINVPNDPSGLVLPGESLTIDILTPSVHFICATEIITESGQIDIASDGPCNAFNSDEEDTDFICSDEPCNSIIVDNADFSIGGIPDTSIPLWTQVNQNGQPAIGWATNSSSFFGSSALWIGNTPEGNIFSNFIYLQQNCLQYGATYEISFDVGIFNLDINNPCYSSPGIPFPFGVRVSAGGNNSIFYVPGYTNNVGGQERFTVILQSTGPFLRFVASDPCNLSEIRISNICVREISPPPNCICHEIRHVNPMPELPQSEWVFFRFYDCTNTLRYITINSDQPYYPCILDSNYFFQNNTNSNSNNSNLVVITPLDQCIFNTDGFCVDPDTWGCGCYETKLPWSQIPNYDDNGNIIDYTQIQSRVDFIDCDGNTRFIQNTLLLNTTLTWRFCASLILNVTPGSAASFRFQMPNGCTTQCQGFLPDPLPPIEGCAIMLNSSTDAYAVYLYDVTSNELYGISLQGPYIFTNLVSTGTPYTDIAISSTTNRFFYKINDVFVGENPFLASYVGYFDIDFANGTYTTGATMNVTQYPPFSSQLDNETINHGLEVSLDGQFVYLSSMNYSSNNDVQSIIICQVVEQNGLNVGIMSCSKLFDLLPGRRVQGDIVRTNENRMFITTTDGERVFVEQWYSDDVNVVLFEFEIVTGLPVGPEQIDIFISNNNLYLVDNNQTPSKLYQVNPEFPYDLQDVADIDTLTNQNFFNNIPEIFTGKFNGAAGFPECNTFRFIYPDPRCRPIMSFSATGNTIRVKRENFLPFHPEPQFILGGNPPLVMNAGVLEIAHTFNFDTNTGRLWILFRPNTSIFLIRMYEWLLTGVQGGNGEFQFLSQYQRQINLNSPTSAMRMAYNNGFTAIDDLTLIIGGEARFTPNTIPTQGWIIQINLPSPVGNLNLIMGVHTQNMFRLPIVGDNFYPENANFFSKSDILYTVDNKLIVVGGPGQAITTGVNTRYILQYSYAVDSSFEFITQITPQNGLHGVLNYNSRIFVWKNNNVQAAGSPYNGYIVNNIPNYDIQQYLNITLGNNNANLLSPANDATIRGGSTVNPTFPSGQANGSIITCGLIRFIPNVPPLIPTLVGCPVFLNSSQFEGIWFYNPDNNLSDIILLPQFGDVATTTYSYRDIAVSNVDNRIYATTTFAVGDTDVFNNSVLVWEVDFETGNFISGPQEIVFVQPVIYNNTRLSEGLEVSPDGNLLYRSVDPIIGNGGDQFSRVVSWDLTQPTSIDNYTELIRYTNGRRVKGDIIRTTNGKLFVSTTDNANIYIEQWSTDDTLQGTTFDGEIVFGPDTYTSFDIFIRTGDETEFYAVSSQGNSSRLWRINIDLSIVSVYTNTNLGTIRGAASYPSCNSFEFDFPDPRCRPLMLFRTSLTTSPTQFFVSRNPLIPGENITPTLLNLGTYPQPAGASQGGALQFTTNIAHVFDLDSNTGVMWINWKPNVGGATTLIINEWLILDEDFTLSFNRQITATTQGTGTSVLRPMFGMTARDRNTLIIGCTTGTTNGSYSLNMRGVVVELDITPANGNTRSLATDTTILFALPLEGELSGTSRKQIVWTDLQYTVDNKIMMVTRNGNGLSSSDGNWVLQYEAIPNGQLELVLFRPQVPQPGLITFENIIFHWSRLGQNIGDSWGGYAIQNTDPYNDFGYNGISSTSGNVQAPPNGLLTGGSSINPTTTSIEICHPINFEPNIIYIDPLPPCPVFLAYNSGNTEYSNTILYYDVNDNSFNEIDTLPNMPTGNIAAVAFSNVSNRIYILTNNILTYYEVDFITGLLISGPITITLPNPVSSTGTFFDSLSTSLDGLSVFVTYGTNSNRVIYLYNTTTSMYTMSINPGPNRLVSSHIMTNNGKLLVALRMAASQPGGELRFFVYQYFVDTVTSTSILETEVLVLESNLFSSLDIFLDNQNKLYGIFVTATVNGVNSTTSQLYEISIYGEVSLLYTDEFLFLTTDAANSPNCATFSFQSLCDPLILFLSTSGTHRARVTRYGLTSGAPVFLDLGTSYNASLLLETSLVETFDIAHSFDFTTNTGFLWIKKVRSTTITYINEWLINDVFYNVTWNRLITLNTSNSQGAIGRIDQGMAYISPNTLVMGAIAGDAWNGCSTNTCRGFVLRVNITNNSISFTDCTILFRLPIVGDANYTGTTNLLIWNDMYYVDNKLVITAKYGQTLTSASPSYVLQYPYLLNATPTVIHNLGSTYTLPTAQFPMTTEGNAYIVRNQTTNWGIRQLITGLNIGITNLLDNLPINQITGPHGVSSINQTPISLEQCEPIPVSLDFCEECDFSFDLIEQNNIGIIVVGNLVSNCQSNITDYVIRWYEDNEYVFSSGLGNLFEYQYPHPLTDTQSPIVPSGTYKPVLESVIIGGIVYSMVSSSNAFFVDLSNCLQTSVTVVCADCLNSNSSDVNYSYEFQYNGATQGVQSPPFQTCLLIPSTVNYVAWEFFGYTAYDNITIYYIGNNYDSPIILDNWNVGTNTPNYNLDANSYLKEMQRPSMKRVICLTGITRSFGFEQLSFEITNPSSASNWLLRFECLETFDCTMCGWETPTGDLFKIDSSTVLSQITDCNINVQFGVRVCPTWSQILSSDFRYTNSLNLNPVSILGGGGIYPSSDANLFTYTLPFSENIFSYANDSIVFPDLICAPTDFTNTITYSKYVNGTSWVIEVNSNQVEPIITMFESYSDAIVQNSIWGCSGCSNAQCLYFEDSLNGPFQGDISQNGIPSWLDSTDSRYYRYLTFYIPTATGATRCFESNDIGGSYNGNWEEGLVQRYFIHPSATVITGETLTGDFFLRIVNSPLTFNLQYDCVLLSQLQNLVNMVNSQFDLPNITLTSQSGSYFLNSFAGYHIDWFTCNSPSNSTTISAQTGFYEWSNFTLPFSSPTESIPQSLAVLCPNVGTNQSTFIFNNGYASVITTYYYRIQNLGEGDFEIYAVPIVDGIPTFPEVLALTYQGGTITFTNPNFTF